MNIIILLGAIQGFVLCSFFLFKKTQNKKALVYFLLFLFSLSFFNLIYALLIMRITEVGGVPVTSFPFPYKYLIGTGFYFYIKSQISKEEQVLSRQEYLLFLPALFYGILRGYWYVILHTGIDKDIFVNVYKSGFFVYNEFTYLIFNLVLLCLIIQFLRKNRSKIKGLHKVQKNWNWLIKFSIVFAIVTLLNLIHQIITTFAGLQDNGHLYVIILVVNTIYIYWVSFESLSKSQFLFNEFSYKHNLKNELEPSRSLAQQLEHHIRVEEIFTNKNLKVSDLAAALDIGEKELSSFIHDHYARSFSDYINHLRVEKVKELIHLEDHKNYTLIALAEIAGFSSKSSFNAVFKKITGLTPSQYKSSHKN